MIFGLAYPLIATGVSQVLFPNKSDGSQVKLDGKTVGSKLIGQGFTIRHPIPKDQRGKFGKKQIKTPDPKYFQPRPSVTTYSPDVTFFNNLGPNNKELMQEFKGYIAAYLALERPYNPGLTRRDVPVDADHDVGLGSRSAHLPGERPDPGPPDLEGPGIPLDRVNQLIDDNTDGRRSASSESRE